MLAAKKAMTPKTGFNVVGVDDYEVDPESKLYLIGHFDSREEAEAERKAREKADPDEVVHIYAAEG